MVKGFFLGCLTSKDQPQRLRQSPAMLVQVMTSCGAQPQLVIPVAVSQWDSVSPKMIDVMIDFQEICIEYQ